VDGASPASYRARLARPATRVERHGDHLRYATVQPLGAHPVNLVEHLVRWGRERPDAPFLAMRDGARWLRWSYGEVLQQVRSLAAALLDAGLAPGARVLVIDRNGVDHAVASLAAMHVGLAVVPLAPAWLAGDAGLAKLRRVIELTRPAALFVGAGLGSARDLLPGGLDVAALMRAISRAAMGAHAEARVDAAAASVTRDTVAKILFTSGSSGDPKGVINTHGMLCAQQQQMAQLWAFLEDAPPVLCEWLPWNHTSGGNNSFNMVLRNGGTLYVDDGRPTEAGIARTIANLVDVRPTWHTNVPLGYSMMLPHLEAQPQAARALLSRLDLLVYGGAPLSAELWTRFERLARALTGRGPPWASGWGLTETTSTITVTHYPVRRAGVVGVPLPGMELKLQPHRGLYLVSVRGPNVTPGYHDPALTARAVDAQGFFHTGDLVRWADPDDPDQGLEFVGRATEEFKLGTGIWVLPGRIKAGVLRHTGPVVKDLVVAGPGQDFLTVFLWLNDELALREFGWSPALDDTAPGSQALQGALTAAIAAYNAQHAGSSERIRRACILRQAPDGAAGELTEKGSINQARFLHNRSGFVDAQYRAGHAAAGALQCVFADAGTPRR
jgi:feruloyl-CoA synthase